MEADTAHNPGPSDLPIRELASPLKGWECELCGFQSSFRTSLINHQAVHSDARPFECQMCDYAAKRKYDLKKHVMLKHRRDESFLGASVFDHSSQLENVSGDMFNMGRSLSPYQAQDHCQPGVQLSSKYSISPIEKREKFSFSPTEKREKLHQIEIKLEPSDVEDDENVSRTFPSTHHMKQMSSEKEFLSRIDSQGFGGVQPKQLKTTLVVNKKCDLLHLGTHGAQPNKQDSHTTSVLSRLEHTQAKRSLEQLDAESDGSRRKHRQPSLPSSETPGKSAVDNVGGIPQQQLWKPSNPSARLFEEAPSSQSEIPTHSEVSCSSVKEDKSCETKKSFLCGHCTILYFDHALYLMHMGLHGRGNPWMCAVCGEEFGEKYSFTSHFINQHSQASSGE
ncbi:zinc finger protein ztf-16-like [Haliotis rufescens]|uniref:zinc finger protein ztf-16-like n=1 Tax=Haliotis rufescens TaxID=6454 RepID=UPI001EB0239A|nr:zinc finger protein ztf-16-like [Haliotis rufescens]XP_046364188.1 zinc finger protein ztf-16-like [Haliotis rufescens]XP_046364189.1 zinc finger protein ztf-16-like [Haliotis rufescens]